jgi:hypothetical protein
MNRDPDVNSIKSIEAEIDIGSNGFVPCIDTNGLDGSAGPSAWVAIVPAGDNPEASSWTILQIGVINCDQPTAGVCSGSKPHYFWAHAGCAGFYPGAIDLGVADWAPHTYRIEWFNTTATVTRHYSLFIDGVWKASINGNHSSIGCWADTNDHTIAEMSAEVWDRGDSIGDFNPTGQRTEFAGITFQNSASNYTIWKTMGLDEYSSCENQPNEDNVGFTDNPPGPINFGCDVVGPSTFNVWSSL